MKYNLLLYILIFMVVLFKVLEDYTIYHTYCPILDKFDS